jgi:hypothetical protein
VTGRHDEREDYADEPYAPDAWLDRMFAGILPIHFVFLVLVPCWWLLAPASLAWAGLGLLACRDPSARRNAAHPVRHRGPPTRVPDALRCSVDLHPRLLKRAAALPEAIPRV